MILATRVENLNLCYLWISAPTAWISRGSLRQ